MNQNDIFDQINTLDHGQLNLINMGHLSEFNIAQLSITSDHYMPNSSNNPQENAQGQHGQGQIPMLQEPAQPNLLTNELMNSGVTTHPRQGSRMANLLKNGMNEDNDNSYQ